MPAGHWIGSQTLFFQVFFSSKLCILFLINASSHFNSQDSKTIFVVHPIFLLTVVWIDC
jgi:hypothetical protein